jgi:tetratricopeptide (TPR) repeat protein
MKTERRHELQQNALADVLTDWIEAVKPYSTAILGGVIAALVLVGVAVYLSQQTQQQQEVAWDQVLVSPETSSTATDEDRQRLERDRLLTVAEQFGDSPAGLYARLMAANIQLNSGIDHLFEDKAKGTDELRQAIKNYTSVLESADEPLLTQQATLGLARAHESLNELQQAREHYQKAVEQKGIYSQIAEARLKDLDRNPTKDFYDWFAQQQPRPQSGSLPGIPGIGPEFNLDSTSPPGDFRLSNPFTEGKADAGKASKEAAGTASTPAVESEEPAGSTTQPPVTSSEPATGEKAGKDSP